MLFTLTSSTCPENVRPSPALANTVLCNAMWMCESSVADLRVSPGEWNYRWHSDSDVCDFSRVAHVDNDSTARMNLNIPPYKLPPQLNNA